MDSSVRLLGEFEGSHAIFKHGSMVLKTETRILHFLKLYTCTFRNNNKLLHLIWKIIKMPCWGKT